jgi:hypothetical protein
MDHLLVQKVKLSKDFYSLTWIALINDNWNDKSFKGERIYLTNKNTMME